MARPRIVSLVPSWTETLIEAGADVVGRTRFCVHPAESVSAIEIVGGTKSVDLESLKRLSPDLIVLDREENTLPMFDAIKTALPTTAVFVSHVESVRVMPQELQRLADACATDAACVAKLLSFSERFRSVLERDVQVVHKTSFVYCIWRDPWMAIGPKTFIASMLERAGFDLTFMWPKTDEKYPTFNVADLPKETLVLLSSEPYPFGRKWPTEIVNQMKLVDGEVFSWFGIRSLRFLEASS